MERKGNLIVFDPVVFNNLIKRVWMGKSEVSRGFIKCVRVVAPSISLSDADYVGSF